MPLPPTGLIGSEQALMQGLGGQLNYINQGVGQAVSTLDPYAQGGGGASQMQAALSGSMGPQAQQSAFGNYQSSPGQQYALEQGRRNLLAGASATGGLGGGNVQRELMRQGIGMAQQNYQQDFNNLGTVANRGMGVAQQQAGYQLQGGVLPAQAVGNTGQMLAQGRLGVGQQLANQAANTTTNMSNLQNQLGGQMANQYGQGNMNLGNTVSAAGQGSSQLQQQLATILANIGTQSGSQQAGYTATAGQYDAAGILGQNQAVQNTLSQLIQMIPQGQTTSPQATSPQATSPQVY